MHDRGERAECRGDTLVPEWVDLRPERMLT